MANCMPYSSIDELPAKITDKLDEADQKQFIAVFNSVYDKDGDEGKAMAAAWGAVKKSVVEKAIDFLSSLTKYGTSEGASAGHESMGHGGGGGRTSEVERDAISTALFELPSVSGQDAKLMSRHLEEKLKDHPKKDEIMAAAKQIAQADPGEAPAMAVRFENKFLGVTKGGPGSGPQPGGGSADGLHARIEAQVRALPASNTPKQDMKVLADKLKPDDVRSGAIVFNNDSGSGNYHAAIQTLENGGRGYIANQEKENPKYVSTDLQRGLKSANVFHSIETGVTTVTIFQKSTDKADSDWQTEFDITKTDDDQQLAFGWLSVSETADGELIIDKQGDIIEPEELEKAAYDFTLDVRKAGDMHNRVEGIGRLVESMVFTKQKQEALGIPEGTLPVGWFVGFRVDDEKVWKKIKSGEYNAFSIGGKGIREKVE